MSEPPIPGLDILQRRERVAPTPFEPSTEERLFDATKPPRAPTEGLEAPAWYADPFGFLNVPMKVSAPLTGIVSDTLVKGTRALASPLAKRAAPYAERATDAIAQSPYVRATTEAVKHYLGPPLGRLGERLSDAGKDFQAWVAPHTVSPAAESTALMLRHRTGQMAGYTTQAELALEEARKTLKYLPSWRRETFIDWMEHGMPEKFPGLDTFAPGVRAAGEAMRALLDDRAQRVQNLGTGALEYLMEDYFPHIWKTPSPQLLEKLNAMSRRQYTAAPEMTDLSYLQQIRGPSPLAGPEAFTKQRILRYYKDGLELGLKPLTDNPIDLVLMKIREIDRYVMGQQVFKEMKDRGIARFFAYGSKPQDWDKIDDVIAKAWNFDPTTGSFSLSGEWYAPQPAARILNRYLGPSLGQQYPSYALARQVSNNMNAASLGLSAFHVTAEAFNTMMSQVALGAQQLSRGELRPGFSNVAQGMLPSAAIRAALNGSKVIQAAREGTGGQQLNLIVDMLTKGGMRFETEKFFVNSAAGSFWENMGKSPISTLLRAQAKPIMEKLVPMLKAGVAFDMAEDALRHLPPGAGEEQIRKAMARVVDTVDNRLGLLVYDNLFWHKALKDLGLLSTRALGWNLGTLREVGGGGVDWARQLTGALRSGDPIVLNQRMGYVMALPFVSGLYGSVFHYLRTGERPETWKDRFYPGAPGSKVSMPTYMNDVFHYSDHPMRTLWGKANPLLHATIDMLNNEDFYGVKIVHREPEDNAAQMLLRGVAQEFAYLGQQYEPFSIRNAWKELKQGNTTAAFGNFLGFTRANKDVQRSPEEQQAFDAWLEQQQMRKRFKRDQNR